MEVTVLDKASIDRKKAYHLKVGHYPLDTSPSHFHFVGRVQSALVRNSRGCRSRLSFCVYRPKC